MIMGGFHLFERSLKETGKDNRNISQEDDKPLHPLQADDLADCDGYESFIMPTKAETKDKGKGKGDWLAKSLVLLQKFVVRNAVHCACSRIPSCHPSRNYHACVCCHEFRDLYFLVEQASQCQ